MSACASRARDRRAQLLALRSRTSTAQADVAWTPIGMSVSFRKPYFEKLSIFHGTKPDASDTQHVRGSGVPSAGERPRTLRSRWPRRPRARGSLGAASRLGHTPALASGLLGGGFRARTRGGALLRAGVWAPVAHTAEGSAVAVWADTQRRRRRGTQTRDAPFVLRTRHSARTRATRVHTDGWSHGSSVRGRGRCGAVPWASRLTPRHGRAARDSHGAPASAEQQCGRPTTRKAACARLQNTRPRVTGSCFPGTRDVLLES